MKKRIERIVRILSHEIGCRPTGSPANIRATDWIEQQMRAAGLSAELQPFHCLRWEVNESVCDLNGQTVPFRVNPFSSSCDVKGIPVSVSSEEALMSARFKHRILMISGALSKEPWMPKQFPFYQDRGQLEVIHAIETGEPAALIMEAPHTKPHFPGQEDGDFQIPSITVPRETAEEIRHTKKPVHIQLKTRIEPAGGANVIARTSQKTDQKIVVCAHMDTAFHTPGALDNAGGVAALMMLAERVQSVSPGISLEFVVFNGEDNYAASGEVAYLNEQQKRGDRILLAINIDGVGYRQGAGAVSSYHFSQKQEEWLETLIFSSPGLVRGPQWPESDHSIFWQQGIPAMALTSEEFDIFARLSHTPADTWDIVDAEKVGQGVRFLERVIREFKPSAG